MPHALLYPSPSRFLRRYARSIVEWGRNIPANISDSVANVRRLCPNMHNAHIGDRGQLCHDSLPCLQNGYFRLPCRQTKRTDIACLSTNSTSRAQDLRSAWIWAKPVTLGTAAQRLPSCCGSTAWVDAGCVCGRGQPSFAARWSNFITATPRRQ